MAGKLTLNQKIALLAKGILGGALVLDAWSSWSGEQPVLGGTERPRGLQLGESPERRALNQARPLIKKAPVSTVYTIEQRLAHIQRLVAEGSVNPRVKEMALSVITRKVGKPGNLRWAIEENDHLGEVTALFKSIRDPNSPIAVRYNRDHDEVDQFHSALLMMKLHGGDCDDSQCLLGAMCKSVGYPVKSRIIQTRKSKSWDHIYLKVGLPPGDPTRWMALDASVDRPAGWEVDGAERCAETGRPSGMVVAVRDFEIKVQP